MLELILVMIVAVSCVVYHTAVSPPAAQVIRSEFGMEPQWYWDWVR